MKGAEVPDPNESFTSKQQTSNDSTNKGTEGVI